MRKLLLGLAVALAVLLALAAQWPAARGIGWLTADTDVTLSDVEGSVWSGSAASGSYRGLRLGKVIWELEPLALLRLEVRAQIGVEGPEVSGEGTLQRSPGGEIELRAVRGRLPAAWLQRILNEPFLGLGGDLLIELERARIGADGRLQALEGVSRWRDARITGRLAAELGSLQVRWRSESPGVILGVLADDGGELELNGLVTITADHYEIDARLRARSDQVALRQALEVFGRPDAEGRVRLRISGPMLSLSRGG